VSEHDDDVVDTSLPQIAKARARLNG